MATTIVMIAIYPGSGGTGCGSGLFLVKSLGGGKVILGLGGRMVILILGVEFGLTRGVFLVVDVVRLFTSSTHISPSSMSFRPVGHAHDIRGLRSVIFGAGKQRCEQCPLTA